MDRFSDFAEEEQPLEGDKLPLRDIVGKEVIVRGYRERSSKYKNAVYVTLQIEIDEHIYIVFTGSTVLRSQVEKYADHLPFVATIKKIDKYYTFT
jgi:hypothetical protein